MAVDFKTFVAVAPHVARVRKPILLRGRHGRLSDCGGNGSSHCGASCFSDDRG